MQKKIQNLNFLKGNLINGIINLKHLNLINSLFGFKEALDIHRSPLPKSVLYYLLGFFSRSPADFPAPS